MKSDNERTLTILEREFSTRSNLPGSEMGAITLFCPTLECWNISSCQWKLWKLFYWRLDNCTETVYCFLLLRMTRMEMECVLKNLATKVLVPILKAKPKLYHGFLFLRKIVWCLRAKFQGSKFQIDLELPMFTLTLQREKGENIYEVFRGLPKLTESWREDQRRTGKILLGELNIICPNETCWSQMHKMILSWRQVFIAIPWEHEV